MTRKSFSLLVAKTGNLEREDPLPAVGRSFASPHSCIFEDKYGK